MKLSEMMCIKFVKKSESHEYDAFLKEQLVITVGQIAGKYHIIRPKGQSFEKPAHSSHN